MVAKGVVEVSLECLGATMTKKDRKDVLEILAVFCE